MEIDRVLLPARRHVESRPGQRRAGRHVVIVVRLRWSTAVRHFSAVIDEAADGGR